MTLGLTDCFLEGESCLLQGRAGFARQCTLPNKDDTLQSHLQVVGHDADGGLKVLLGLLDLVHGAQSAACTPQALACMAFV